MTTKPIIHIALGADNNYGVHCCVTILSAVVNSPEAQIHAHIITTNMTEATKTKIKASISPYQAKVFFYTIQESDYQNLTITSGKRLNMATYNRLFIPQLLPESITKVLYLDCDVIVNHSLLSLYNTELKDNAVGAAMVDETKNIKQCCNSLQLSIEDGYFNAGVLLINLTYWREYDVCKKCMNYLQQYPERVWLDDQDLLNAILNKKVLWLEHKYNVLDGYYKRYISKTTLQGEVTDIRQNPKIIHYGGPHKPWNKNCDHPFAFLYEKYLNLSTFPHFSLWHKLTRKLRPLKLKLGLGKRRFKTFDEF